MTDTTAAPAAATSRVRLITYATIGDELRLPGWEGGVDAALARRMRDDGVAEPEPELAAPETSAPDAAGIPDDAAA